MEIGPITAVRPVPVVKPSPAAPDLSRVFEVEYLGQSADDEYTPANRKAGRGLEDEEDEAAEDLAEAGSDHEPVVPSGNVSFFA